MPPFDGSGQFVLPVTTVTPAVSTTTIDSADFNTFTGDIETALSLCITNDGQTTTPRINLPNINEAVNMTSTSTELNLLDGATVTTTEINNIDGGTAATSTTVATGDRVVYNDNGTMVQIDVDDLDTYFSATIKTLTNKDLTSPTINGNAVLNTKVIDIGTWNMDLTTLKSVAHGLTLSKIRSIAVLIRNDADNIYVKFPSTIPAGTGQEFAQAEAADIDMSRAAEGAFDSTGFVTMGDDGNRGWITIEYTD